MGVQENLASAVRGAISTGGRRSRPERSCRAAGLDDRRTGDRPAFGPGRSSFRSPPWCKLRGRLIGVAGSCFFQFVGFFLIFKLKEVGYIEEGVAFKAYVDKCRLHAGQHVM